MPQKIIPSSKKKWRPPPVRKKPILYVNYSLMNVWWYHLNHEKNVFHISQICILTCINLYKLLTWTIFYLSSHLKKIYGFFFFLKFSIFLILSLNWRSWKGEKTYWHLKKYTSFFFLLEYTNIIVCCHTVNIHHPVKAIFTIRYLYWSIF